MGKVGERCGKVCWGVGEGKCVEICGNMGKCGAGVGECVGVCGEMCVGMGKCGGR